MDAFIDRLGINDYLSNCKFTLTVQVWEPRRLLKPTKCNDRFNEKEKDKQVLAIVNTKTNLPVSLIKYQFMEDLEEDEEYIYIVYTCTEDKYACLGLSKLLHYVLIVYGMSLGMVSANAIINDKTEQNILQSFGGKPVDRELNFQYYGYPYDFVVPFDNTVELPSQISLVAEQIQRCKRPLRKLCN